MGSMLLTSKVANRGKNPAKHTERLTSQAVEFINQFYASVKRLSLDWLKIILRFYFIFKN